MDTVTHISLRRTRDNVIEYDLTITSPMAAVEQQTHTYHANRTATFFGPHTGGGDARQIEGGARTLWRDDDNQMLMAFRRKYPFASVAFA